MADSRFVYVTYIRTTPEKHSLALFDPEFTRRFWCGDVAGMRMEAGRDVADHDPQQPRRRQQRGPRDPRAPEGSSSLRVAKRVRSRAARGGLFADDLPGSRRAGESVKLTIIHEMDRPDSTLIAMVSTGWPVILSSLKSLLETGESL